MERNIIIENICTACHCGERRAEEYLAVELRNLRELRDAGALCYGDLETACSGLAECTILIPTLNDDLRETESCRRQVARR
ncbi:hypothetical protein F2R85_14845 [Alistipes onderdonkii]|nr:hypothetical protein F2R85_14845 [Alistipes onderdonkii]